MGRITPPEADDLEMWEIAVLLGHSNEVGDDKKSRSNNVAATMEQRAADALERNRARLAASRGQGPQPEAATLDPAGLHQLAGSLSRGST